MTHRLQIVQVSFKSTNEVSDSNIDEIARNPLPYLYFDKLKI